MNAGRGVDSLQHFEDRVLYHTVMLVGERPLGFNEGVSEADIAVAMAEELGIGRDFPYSPDFHTAESRNIVLKAVSTLGDDGLLEVHKIMGPWTISPTRRGRQQVADWRSAWQKSQQNTDRAVQQRILEELDQRRRDKPNAFITQIDPAQLCLNLDVTHDVYLANAKRLLNQGKIRKIETDQTSIDDGYAAITESGIQALERMIAPQRPMRDAQEAWVEVARLKRQLQLAERSLPSVIADSELRRRCADLLTAEADYDRAIREACVILEDRVRTISGAGRGSYGVSLMDSAFSKKNGTLRLSDHEQEQEGAHQIYRGYMAFFRNAAGHNLSAIYTQEDAIRFVVSVDLLLHMLNSAKFSH